jgi:ElaB/YqjD/DUF883 family membrane-anchored ribosome-binding protein
MTSEQNNTESTSKEQQDSKVKRYERLISRLKKERGSLQDFVDQDYREARRYVRSHPEEGVTIAFVGGLALGYIIGKLGR